MTTDKPTGVPTIIPLPQPEERPEDQPEDRPGKESSVGEWGALRTERGNLPLRAVDIDARVVGLVAETRMSQEFVNSYDEVLEATYVFPLPDRAAVTSLTMEAAGRVVEAELRERGEARQAYDDAVSEGRRAAITEQERSGVFTLRVGNISPGETVTVRLTMCGPLPYEDDAATYRFPLVVAPRYVPGSPIPGPSVGDGVRPDTDVVPDASRVTPPVLIPGSAAPVRLALSVTVDPAGLALNAIRPSLSTMDIEELGDGVVRLTMRPGQRLDRDVIVRLEYGGSDVLSDSLVVVDDVDDSPGKSGDDENRRGVFALTLLPTGDSGGDRTGRDVVVVLDRSGSMGGWKMVAARRAAARIVDTLTAADRFAVLSFDNVVERPEFTRDSEGPRVLVPATDRNRFRAVEFLSGTQARGGTEMAAPLAEAVQLLSRTAESGSPGDSRSRESVVVLVTDGQVANEAEIVAMMSREAAGVRVHAVGIDEAVNAGFLYRLATVGGGRCELVESEDRLDAAMTRIHRRIGRPLATGLTVDTVSDAETGADGLARFDIESDTLAPARLPDLFAGVPWRVTGRFTGTPRAIRVRGRAADGSSFSRVVRAREIDGPASAANSRSAVSAAVRAGWAVDHLADLDDGYQARYGFGTHHDPDGAESLEKRMVGVSLRYSVLCRFTAYVAVDTRVSVESGPTRHVIQPVEIPSGWEQPAPGAGMMLMRAMPAAAPAAPAGAQTYGAPSYGGPPAAGAPAESRSRSRFWSRRSAPAAFSPVESGADENADDLSTWASVRTLLSDELKRMDETANAADLVRCQFLSDLASRLVVILNQVPADVSDDRFSGLRDLVEPCRACEDTPLTGEQLETLWRDVRRELRALTTEVE